MVANGTIEAGEAVMTGREAAELIAVLTSQNQQLSVQIEELKFQLAWFKRQLFGAKSEKLIPIGGDQLLSGVDNQGLISK